MENQPSLHYFEMYFTLPNIALESCFYSFLDKLEIVDADEGYAMFKTTEQTAHSILMSSIGSVFLTKVVLTPESPCDVEATKISLPISDKKSKKDTK
jgi:hypothetical protein